MEAFRKSLPFPKEMEGVGDDLVRWFVAQEEFGYFGPGQVEKIAWARKRARGRLITLIEYFQASPLLLK